MISLRVGTAQSIVTPHSNIIEMGAILPRFRVKELQALDSGRGYI